MNPTQVMGVGEVYPQLLAGLHPAQVASDLQTVEFSKV